MKAHIARNQNAGVPLALGWNLSAADRGILEGMAPAFGMKLLLVSPADAGRTVAQLLGEVEVRTTRTLVLEPGAYPPALVLAISSLLRTLCNFGTRSGCDQEPPQVIA